MYLPDPPAPGSPTVVFLDRGAWGSGRRQDHGFVGEAPASRGIVTLAAHTTSTARALPGVCAIQRARPALAGRPVDRAQATAGRVGLAGPCDLLPIGAPEAQRAFEWPQPPADSLSLLHARRTGAGRSFRALLLAARNDTLVDPRRNTPARARTLGQHGIAVETERSHRGGHTTLIGAPWRRRCAASRPCSTG